MGLRWFGTKAEIADLSVWTLMAPHSLWFILLSWGNFGLIIASILTFKNPWHSSDLNQNLTVRRLPYVCDIPHRNMLFPHYLLGYIEEEPIPPQLYVLPLCWRALAETGCPAGWASGLTCWSFSHSQAAGMYDGGLITAVSPPCTFSIWHLYFQSVMAITRSLKEAWKVRNRNAIVWNAIYYFQITKRDALCMLHARGTGGMGPAVKAGMSHSQNQHRGHI